MIFVNGKTYILNKIIPFSKLVSALLLLLFFASCKPISESNTNNLDKITPTNKYALGFSIEKLESYTKVQTFNPWNTDEIQAMYYLVRDANIEVPTDGTKIKVPITSIASSSVTHLEFLSLIDELETLTAVCNASLVYNEKVRDEIENKNIIDLGDAFQINIEKTLQLRPNALMMSSFNNKDANAERLMNAGIPIVFNNEWMETSLLGRAEWIKFVAAFYDKVEVADSIFMQIENDYLQAKEEVSRFEKRPKVIWGNNYRGTWYMPGGASFMSNLLEDAGADYFYFDDDSTGSLPLDFESVLKNFANADIWLNCNFDTLEELFNEDDKHKLFSPAKNGEVYNFRKRFLPSTANDYWESAIARPDILLKDVIAILHPDLLTEHDLVYSSKLK